MPSTLANPAVWILTQTKVVLWLLVVTRLSGMLVSLPGLGQEGIPVQLRAALAILMASILTPVIPAASLNLPSTIWEMCAFLLIEFATGLLLGLLVSWIVEALAFGGYLMDLQMGFSFVQFLDPVTAQPASISGSLLTQLAVLFIFLSGLHHQMILALVESYRIAPIATGLPSNPLPLVIMLGQLLARGFQLALPVLLTLFFVDVLEGISARYMPQLQLIQISFPIKIMVGLALLAVLLRNLWGWLAPLFNTAPREALRLLG